MRLRLIRKQKKLTQVQLEALSGVDQGAISQLEQRVKLGLPVNPNWTTVAKLCAALGVTPDELMDREPVTR